MRGALSLGLPAREYRKRKVDALQNDSDLLPALDQVQYSPPTPFVLCSGFGVRSVSGAVIEVRYMTWAELRRRLLTMVELKGTIWFEAARPANRLGLGELSARATDV